MQTNFRGRDFIGDLDFTKEEVETVLDVAWDLKRKRALGEPHAYLRDKVLAMLFFFLVLPVGEIIVKAFLSKEGFTLDYFKLLFANDLQTTAILNSLGRV